MSYVVGTILFTLAIECFILWYGMKYGFINPKRNTKDREREVY